MPYGRPSRVKLGLLLATVLIVILIKYLAQEQQVPGKLLHYHNKTEAAFTRLAAVNIFGFNNVCIEVTSLSQRWHNTSNINDYNCAADKLSCRIVIYDETVPADKRVPRTIQVQGSQNSLNNKWNLEFGEGKIPDTHHFDQTISAAYFVVPTCPGNLHHFFIDEFVPLWNVINQTGGLSLTQTSRNLIAYKIPYHLTKPEDADCHSVKRYESILYTLHTDVRHEAFWLTKTNTCFPHAVFGVMMSNSIELQQHVVRYVVKTMLGDATSAVNYVTILQRRRRRLLNVDEMLKATSELVGEKRARVVTLEDLPVEKQVQVAAESCVMIGIHGAGLQWGMFMNATETPTSLIEISWPSMHWGFYYNHRPEVASQRLQLSVDSNDVFLNWTSYEWEVHRGRRLSDAERQHILNLGKPVDGGNNLWKWSDVRVNTSRLQALLAKTHFFKSLTTRRALTNSYSSVTPSISHTSFI